MEPVGKGKIKAKRKPLSTPASPSRAREPQCTCMTPEQYARIRSQDPRYRGTVSLVVSLIILKLMHDAFTKTAVNSLIDNCSFAGSSTLPRATTRGTETDGIRGDKVTAATSSTSLYDNVSAGNQSSQINAQGKQKICGKVVKCAREIFSIREPSTNLLNNQSIQCESVKQQIIKPHAIHCCYCSTINYPPKS